ncbi:MAG: hypothetical protein ABSF29_00235 [Tepidisphaeraceae bacterium]
MIRKHPTIFPHLIPCKRLRLFWPAAGLLEGKKQQFEIEGGIPHQRSEFRIGHEAGPGHRPRAFHPLQRVAGEYPFLARPGECPVNGAAGVPLRRLVPPLPVHPAGDVDGLQFGNRQVAGMFRKCLAEPKVIAIGFFAAVNFRPGEKSLDDIGNASRSCFGRLGLFCRQFVELLLGQFFVLAPVGKADSLSAEGNHPAADILAKPDFVRTGHTKPPVEEASKKRLDRKFWLCGPGVFFSPGREFSTEFSTEPWLGDTGAFVSPCQT